MIRVLLLFPDERLDFDPESYSDDVQDLLKKVGTLSPQDYTWKLTYKEKIDLLMLMVDALHDLESFRVFLNKRLEDRSTYFK
jgi:hypothetical protein